jgi:HTH-like domain/Integrase core domain
MEKKRALIEPEHPTISLARQCELVDLARSSYYYQPVPESEENLLLMRLLDEQYTRTPFYGIKKMTAWLRTQGYEVNHKRVARLLRQMGLMAIYPSPRLSQPGEQQVRYPYLLRGLSIDRVNQVWSTDITYIRLQRGFLYLVAIIDWFSRYVLAWRTSITLETAFVSKRSSRHLWGHDRRFLTTTRDRSLPVWILLVAFKQKRFASVGMAAAERWTIFSSKDSGEASSMRRCISRSISRSLTQKEG